MKKIYNLSLVNICFLNNVCIPNVSMYCPGHTEYEADFVYFSMKNTIFNRS